MPSSPITAVCTDSAAHCLLGVLSKVPDPRDPRGVRYPLSGVLAVAVCAVLAGARSFAAIGEWALELHDDQLEQPGLDRAPVESTMRKLFARLDAAALDRQFAVLAWCRTGQIQGRRVIAVDGKTIRGARHHNRATSDRGARPQQWRRYWGRTLWPPNRTRSQLCVTSWPGWTPLTCMDA